MGKPLMPWQRLVAAVGGEIDPATGLPAYREVIVTVPRQSGKTTLILGWQFQRALGWGSPQRIAYSAQSGNEARKKLLDDWLPIINPRKKALGVRRVLIGNGNESVEFGNGSRIILIGSADDSGHGKTLDMGVKDELFADTDDRRDQALIPAMATRRAGQVLTMSTMGTDESVPLNRAIDRGREAVASGVRSRIAYFEWSASPDDDPDDPATWWSMMPALGETIDEEVVAQARATMLDGEFWRAFLNVRTKSDDRVLPLAEWLAVCNPAHTPTGTFTFALDVNPERSAGSIVAAAGGVAELIDYRPGTGWMVDRAKELSRKWGRRARWIIDPTGPAGSLVAEMETARLKVHLSTARDMIDACGQLYDGVIDGTVKIRRHEALDAAAAAAGKRVVGDAWAWTRKGETDICPLVALTLALWGSANAPKRSVSVMTLPELERRQRLREQGVDPDAETPNSPDT